MVTVPFAVDPTHVEEFRRAVCAQARASLGGEPACHRFDVALDPDDPTVCFLYERYTNRAAFEAHLASDHFRHFAATVGPWVRDKQLRCFERIEDLCGPGPTPAR